MSRNAAMDAARMEKNKQRVLRKALELFAEKDIENVSMPDIAKAVKMDRSSIYRYFPSKLDLVIAISATMWQEFAEQNFGTEIFKETAAERYELWLDSFLDLYRNHRGMLRFNQFFNVYVASEEVPPEQMEPFARVITELEKRFHDVYVMGQEDGTLRTDLPEQRIFSVTLHLMLAAVTRYAVGLIYEGATEPEEELLELKEMLMHRFVTAK